MKYETVIGLEVHVQIKTKTKIFCSCSTEFGTPSNENTCPVCLGMPGVLPVLNKRFLESSMRACLATHCTIEPMNRFARKNYFYPDLPKGYQISQFELPLGTKGYININVNGTKKRIGLTRIHMEEDAGKLIHGINLGSPGKSYVDFNRTGVPLCEVVSEPDMRSAEEARAYLTELKTILEYTEVSDCNMEQGSLRCDANVSIRPFGQKEFGTRAELKNLNSFKFIQKAIEYEVDRQTKILDQGETVKQETRLYDSDRNETLPMRSKEEAHDYRYFPDPDLVPIVINEDWVAELQNTMPELPEQKRERFIKSYGIPEYDVGVLTSSKHLADYFEQCASLFPHPKIISNWLMGDLLRELKKDGKNIADCPVSPSALVDLLKLINSGTISGKIAKVVLEEMYQTQQLPDSIIEKKGLKQITDSSAIEKIVDQIIESNPSQVEEFKGGKEKVIGYLVGQVMQASKGKANPSMVNKLLKEKMSI
ncbi:MAG TPA: Asp-tRNA(Asn)/Glu-tRNA(Gln) amidotransferase subunit GatB [Nitrospinaceae bacterium]|nr:Asp-tRNA(Asn)/Glu-tRNA(Gln) amidotransferase subunit GatB [Nitrospinaceae bacterium]